MSTGPTNVVIEVTPLKFASVNGPWRGPASLAISDLNGSGLDTNTVLTDSTRYAEFNYLESVTNLVYSEKTPLWGTVILSGGDLRGLSRWDAVYAYTLDGSDSISLDSFCADSFSDETAGTAGLLSTARNGGTLYLTGLTYGPQAVGWRSDGTVLNSGQPSSALCSRVIFFVMMPQFTVETQADIDGASRWFNDRGSQWRHQVAISTVIPGVSSVATLSKGNRPKTITINLTENLQGDLMLVMKDAEIGLSYRLLTSGTVPGQWITIGVLSGRDQILIPKPTTNQFYKVFAQ
ncbi:MAG: hypothetical protein M1459_02290 [Patescibacteria group bacterium]|nr:hypothetical protein [Patescibacteria group bacterium]